MNKKIIIPILIVVALIALLFFTQFRTGNVVASIDSIKVGDKLQGNLKLTIEDKDNLNADAPLIFSITKGRDVKEVQTFTLKDFISSSDNPQESQPYKAGTYTVPISSITNYTFTENGNYEVFFSMPRINYVVQTNVAVK